MGVQHSINEEVSAVTDGRARDTCCVSNVSALASSKLSQSNVHDELWADVVRSIRCAVAGLHSIKHSAVAQHSLEFGEPLEGHVMCAAKLSSVLQLLKVQIPVESLVLPLEVA